MDTQNLLLLADLLEKNAKNPSGMKFDLCHVLRTEDDVVNPSLDCGTSGCAIGLACLSPEFPMLNITSERMNHLYISYEGVDMFWETAARQVFDINTSWLYYLFMPEYYPKDRRRRAEGELAVAERIRAFVAGTITEADMKDYGFA